MFEDCCSLQMCVYNHSIVSKARCTKSLSPLSFNSAGPSWDSEQESTALNYCACMYVNLQHGDHSVVHLFMEAEIVFTQYTARCRIHTNKVYVVHLVFFSEQYIVKSQVSLMNIPASAPNPNTFTTFHLPLRAIQASCKQVS